MTREVKWLAKWLSYLDDYTCGKPRRRGGPLREVRAHLPSGYDETGQRRLPKLRIARRSLSLPDTQLQLTAADVGREFLVRVPWGVSTIGGFVFFVALDCLTETQAVFRTLYHVGRLEDGSRVYTWNGYRFGINRRDVRGREVVRGDAGQVRAQARVGVTPAEPGGPVPGDRATPRADRVGPYR